MQLTMNIMHKQSGFSMLEALITLLIVSLGLLGIAGIIANSLKVNQGAQARSQASWLANDIIDRMRANRTTAETTPAAYTLAGCDAIPAVNLVATADLTQWCAAVTAALPASTGSVVLAANKVTVTVDWDDSSRLEGDAVVDGSGTFVVETRL
ncbi:MAG TPA: type IV pilus modification protein PilV [Thiobacillus sp.]|nr:type IV pilus modification protein PilV [Thiobacillus sp.]